MKKLNEKGQATAEYALVLVLAAVIAVVVTKFVGQQGADNPISSLFGGLVDKVWDLGSGLLINLF